MPCRGQLNDSGLSLNTKQSILLPKNPYFIELVIKEAHSIVLLDRVNATLAGVRRNFWIPKVIQAIRRVLRSCNYRTISLMSHMTKVTLKILLQRMRGRTKGETSEEQFGFMPDKGTRNAIFTLRMITERCVEMQKDEYICFIDYAKAFDKVQHVTLFEVLQELDINGKDLELIMNLYWQQQASVRIGQDMSDWVNIARGVRQGCVLSPALSSLYTEMVMRKIGHMDGLRIGGLNVNNIRHADDTAIVADSEEQLQNLITVIADESRKFGLEINKKKTFCVTISKKSVSPKCNLDIDGIKIK